MIRARGKASASLQKGRGIWTCERIIGLKHVSRLFRSFSLYDFSTQPEKTQKQNESLIVPVIECRAVNGLLERAGHISLTADEQTELGLDSWT